MVRFDIFLAVTTCVAAFTSHSQLSAQGRMVLLDAMISLDDTNYEKHFKDKVVLVNACARWCGPCKLIEPVLNRCMKKWEGTIYMAKFDVEAKNPELKLEFLLQDVMPKSLPCLILFQNGKALAKQSGVIAEDDLDEFIETNLRCVSSSHEQGPSALPKKKTGFISFTNGDKDDYMLSNSYL
jgi:thioredoxin-like negative regulator of GroEL